MEINENEDTELAAVSAASIPAEFNVRLLITGLAVCDLAAGKTEINFIRHAPHHELEMRIRNLTTGRDVGCRKIAKDERVEITQTDSVLPGSYDYNGSLCPLISLNRLHDSDVEYSASPTGMASGLAVENFQFYSHELTRYEFKFSPMPNPYSKPQNFCETLGGYMKFSGQTHVTVNGVEFFRPLESDDNGKEMKYEISFINDCTDEAKCDDDVRLEQDFKYVYDLIESGSTRYRLEGPFTKAIVAPTGTGACLPVCRTC